MVKRLLLLLALLPLLARAQSPFILTSDQSQCLLYGPTFASCSVGGMAIYDDGSGGTVYSPGSVTAMNWNLFGYGPAGRGDAENRSTVVEADNGVIVTAGIKNGRASSTAIFGAGDALFRNYAFLANGGVWAHSDQGTQGEYMVVGQPTPVGTDRGYFMANVITGVQGSQSPMFTNVHGCRNPLNQACFPSPVSTLLDIETPQATSTLTGPSVSFPDFGSCHLPFLQQLPTSGGLPKVTAGGCKLGSNIAPHTTWDAPVIQTITLQDSFGTFTPGVACVFGPNFHEKTRIISVNGLILTVALSRPNVDFSIFQGDCSYLSFDADLAAVGGTRTAYPAFSIDGINLVYAVPAYSAMGNITLPIQGAEAETTDGTASGITLYCGARVSMLASRPAPFVPIKVLLEPNECTWKGAVEDPDFPVQNVTGIEINANMNNPATPMTAEITATFTLNGMGASTNSHPLELDNRYSPDCAMYAIGSCKGKLVPPSMIVSNPGGMAGGYWQHDLWANYAPALSVLRFQNHFPGQISFDLLEDDWTHINVSPRMVTFSDGITSKSQITETSSVSKRLTVGTGGGGDPDGLSFTFAQGMPETFLSACSQNPWSWGGQNTDLCLSDGARDRYYRVQPNRSLHLNVLGAVEVHATRMQETLHTPSSASEPCSAGQFTDDLNYHYVCVVDNRWKRSALEGF